MKKHILMGAVVLMAGVLFSACMHTPADTAKNEDEAMMEKSGDAMEKDGDAMMEGDAMEKNGEAMMEEDGVLKVTMDAGEFFFAPNVINAKPGQTVEVTLTNTNGTMIHDFVLDEMKVATTRIAKGEQDVVTFTVPEAAAGQSYEFYCSVGQHRAQGMVGTLVVSQ